MTNHCFISYSTADALDFARKLANELEGGEDRFIPVWLDKRDIDPARDWDEQIVDGIRACKCMLFVMTADSTMPNSMCKNEWNWALRYKKPVVPIRLHGNVEQPFGLGNRQWIDFTGEFKAGLAKLRKFIQRMDEPEGILEALKDRLMDAERGLQRAKPEDEARIKAEMDDLKAQIARQEEIVKDPKAAAAQTQKNIETGLEREREPVKPVAGKASTKFINPPPGIAPTYFQDRLLETEQVIHFLQNDAQRMMTVAGRGGVGKTAMVCRLLKHLESGELPDGKGKLSVEGIVYLSETGTRRVNFPHLFADLSKLLPAESAKQLEALYKDPQTSVDAKMHALLEAFPSNGQIVLLLDNFESVVEAETQQLKDAELDEALRAVLHAPHHALKVLITTRIAPRELNLLEPARQRLLTLDEGLDSPYAEQILRQMDEDGKLGLKTAPEDLLQRAKERTRGYPRALEALFAILSSDRYTTLEELLNQPTPENVVEALVGEAFSRLDPTAQKVMQALAIYGRPVAPAAVDYLLQPHLPGVDSAPALQRLVNMHFVRRESGRFYLHPVDKEYALGKVPENQPVTAENVARKEVLDALKQSIFSRHDLLERAADYFKQARKPRAEWKKLDDLAAQLAEFDLRCVTGDYDTAASVLTDFDFDYLLLWGHYRLTIDLYEKLQGKIINRTLAQICIGNLGTAYRNTGKVSESISCYEKAVHFAQEDGNKQGEEQWLMGIGNCYYALGYATKAIDLYEKSLNIAREIRNKRDEGTILGNLGNTYTDLGETHKAIEFYEKRLEIAREIGDIRGESSALCNLGNTHAIFGDARKAIKFYEQTLIIAREIGDRRSEDAALGNLGAAYANLGEAHKAIEFHEKQLVIAREIGDRDGEGAALGNLGAVYADLGEVSKAIEFYEQTLIIANETGDRRGEGSSLGKLGAAYANLGEAHKAIEFYEKQLVIARETGDRRGEDAALGNLGNEYAGLGDVNKAIEFHELALAFDRKIGDRRGESTNLGNLGNRYLDLDDARKAIEYYEQSLVIAREIGDRRAETINFGNIGFALLRMNKNKKSIDIFMQSIHIADEISYPDVQIEERWGLAQAYLFQNDLVNARTAIEAALQYDVPENNHNASALHGIIALRQGEVSAACQAFTRASAQADELLAKTPEYYSALDAKGLALCGLALTGRGDPSGPSSASIGGNVMPDETTGPAGRVAPTVAEAIETFRKARKVAPHAGVVKSVLRLFDELVKCDPDGVLKEVRAAAEGKE
jgi:tetratricopeptide (TPR) repeat protein